MEEIKGYVEHIVYRNEDNGYTVFHLNNSDGEVTCVGNFHFIEEGELLRLTGGYTTHKMYGLQFAVEESEVCEPEDLISIERYLGSGAIKGIGAALAGKIVKKFKENTFRIIEEEPETTGGNQGNQRTESKRDCFSGGRKERYASGDDLSAEVWNFNDACGERSISIMAVMFTARLRRIRISWRIMFRGLDLRLPMRLR